MSFEVTGFDHMVLKCRDVDKALWFYGEVLEMEVLRLDQFRAGNCGVGVVATCGAVAPEIHHLMAGSSEVGFDLLFGVKAAVVAGNRNVHASTSWRWLMKPSSACRAHDS